MRAFAMLLVFAGCGGANWTPDDATNAHDIANAALSLEAVCDRDGGPCPGAAVRAMERGTYCSASAMMSRHGMPAIDGGVACVR